MWQHTAFWQGGSYNQTVHPACQRSKSPLLPLQVHEATIEFGAYPSPYNYFNFPKSVCTSINEIICHGIPDRRPLQEGDIVNVDVSVYYKGYHGEVPRLHGYDFGVDLRFMIAMNQALCEVADLTAGYKGSSLFAYSTLPRWLGLPAGDLNETFVVGEVDERSKELIKVTHDVSAGLLGFRASASRMAAGAFKEQKEQRGAGLSASWQPHMLCCVVPDLCVQHLNSAVPAQSHCHLQAGHALSGHRGGDHQACKAVWVSTRLGLDLGYLSGLVAICQDEAALVHACRRPPLVPASCGC